MPQGGGLIFSPFEQDKAGWRILRMMAEAAAMAQRPQRKIARTEWKVIAGRYAAGESLARIARDYGCTAPAIRYVVQQASKLGFRSESEVAEDLSARARGGAIERQSAARTDPVADSTEASPDLSASRTAAMHAESGLSGFDPGLRDMVTVEVSTFLVALDSVMVSPASVDFDRLRGATDRLLRAAARVRIELERFRQPSASVSSIRDNPAILRRHASGGTGT